MYLPHYLKFPASVVAIKPNAKRGFHEVSCSYHECGNNVKMKTEVKQFRVFVSLCKLWKAELKIYSFTDQVHHDN
jgi:hypothetical protein